MSGTFPTTLYFNQFNTVGASTSVLGPEWGLYDSVGNAGNGFRKPAQIQVVAEATATSGSNVLRITSQNVGGSHWSGGMQLLLPRTYGQYELRVRCADDASQVTSGVVLLWPESNQWPRDGEIDFWESFGNRNTRTPVESFVHRLNPAAVGPTYTNADDQLVVEYHHTGVDQSDWHKIVCSWTPDEIYMNIDNGSKILLTNDPSHIPDWPMNLCLQLDAWSPTPPATPVTMDIDYVLVRSWQPAASTSANNMSMWDGLRWSEVVPWYRNSSNQWEELDGAVNIHNGVSWQS